jgi:hypothetical protein
VQPRDRTQAASAAADKPAAAATSADDVQMQITFTGAPSKLRTAMQQMGMTWLLDKPTPAAALSS